MCVPYFLSVVLSMMAATVINSIFTNRYIVHILIFPYFFPTDIKAHYHSLHIEVHEPHAAEF